MAWQEYIDEVLSGERIEGELMQLCVKRFIALRHRPDIEFREKRVQRVIDFFSILHHFKGKSAGKAFILQPWQEFIIAYIFGLYKGGKRLVHNVYIEIARKNGKTAFASGLAMYCAMADGEPGAEVDLAANSKDQAKIAYEFAESYARQLDGRGNRLKVLRDRVADRMSKSKLQVFASDDTKLDGFDASVYLLDEYHAAKNSRLRDVLQSSQGTRENPLGIIITTAGFDKLSPCYKYRTMCSEVLHGVKVDDTTAAFIYAMDEGDDWQLAENWAKCNPNLDVTVTSDYIANEVMGAKNLAENEVGVRTKTLNQWCDSAEVWIPDHYIISSTKDIKPEEMEGMEWYGGVDLSATTDLTAIGMAGRRSGDDNVYIWVHYYLPQESLNENRFKLQYGEWARAGALTLTPGNVTDYDIILDDLKKLHEKCYFRKIGYDAWNATQFVINAEQAGLPMRPFSQTLGNFNKPTKEFERLMLSGRIVLDNNIINRHCLRNVQLAVDRNGNTKPSKQFQEKKIDGVIVMLEALGMMIEELSGGGLI